MKAGTMGDQLNLSTFFIDFLSDIIPLTIISQRNKHSMTWYDEKQKDVFSSKE